MRCASVWVVLCMLGAAAPAAPQSGDVFREYIWAGPWVNGSHWQRVTGPDAIDERAKENLPNPVNRIVIADLDKAHKVEVYIEMLLCHGGTINKRIRVNGNAWITIPESPYIPGRAGTGPPDSEYQSMRYPCVEVPLEQLQQGENTFEFTCSRGTSLGGRWPQWILYGVTFRIYYDNTKPHVEGAIVSPRSGETLADQPVVQCKVAADADVNNVDVIGLYEDFNWEGDGQSRQWHYRYRYGRIQSHIGMAAAPPWKVTWNNTWVPTQQRPMALMARVVDKTGLCTMTPMVKDIRLVRQKTVKMHTPYQVPKRWSTRAGSTHRCKIDVDEDPDTITAAVITMCTWNGVAGKAIGINGHKVVTNVGGSHDLSYDSFAVPVDWIKPGTNTLYTFSDTIHHGLEVQWPGMVLLTQYDKPESDPKATTWDFEPVVIDEHPLQPQRITDVAAVDIDNDGRIDLWFSGSHIPSQQRKSAWYRNTGDPHRWERYTPFPGPSLGAAWADVDGDGDMDLITGGDRDSSKTGNHAMVWLENPLHPDGDPTQGPWAVHQIHANPTDPDEVHTDFIDSAGQKQQGLDLNHDGRLDIVIAAFKQTLWYVPGPEDPKLGPWAFHKIAEAKEGHGGAVVADIDRDGDLDVVWGIEWYENPGNPSGEPWAKHIIDEDWTHETQVEIADLDGDGRLDVVLSGEETDHGLAWYHNPGAKSSNPWPRHRLLTGWKGLHSLELADFDKDGDLDFLIAQMHTTQEKRVAIVENIDLTQDVSRVHIIETCGSHKAIVCDVDRDGDLDIVGKNFEKDTRPRIWLNPNKCKLSLNQWRRHLIDGQNDARYTVCSGDLNSDGRQDIVAGTAWYGNPGHAGQPWDKKTLGAALNNTMLLYDLDSDGDLDVLGQGFAWARNNGQGGFDIMENINAKGGFLQGFAIGRLCGSRPLQVPYTYKNGDGIHLLTVPAKPAEQPWTSQKIYGWTGLSKCIALGDIDRDGDLDILFTGRDAPTIQWLRTEKDGSFTAFDLADSPAQINHRCFLADINRDGRLDAVIAHKGQMVTWFEQADSPTAKWTKHVVAGPELLAFDPLSLDAADMDRDGDLDLIVGEHTPDKTHAYECKLYILENVDSIGTRWQAHRVHTGDEHHQGAHVTDIDSDGDMDILSVGWTHNQLLLYENRAIITP